MENEGGKLAVAAGDASVEPAWPGLLASAVRDVEELWRLLDLPASALPGARRAVRLFPLLVPRGFVARMRRGDLTDPLLLQVVPALHEEVDVVGYTADPLAEGGCQAVPGLLHKYRGRALLVTTGACAVHCRYCFRRHYAYGDLPRGRRWWDPAVAWLRANADIDEVLLSGGDPLTLPDAILAELASDLAAIPHLRRLRIHSRLPVVLPERIDRRFLAWFGGGRLQPVMVIHSNHAQEIDVSVAGACARMRTAGVTVLNQTVLLTGVNDAVQAQCELARALMSAGVLPYYLHQLDRVAGAAHFAVDDATATALHRDMAACLPGYLVPRLVREVPGAPGKTALV